MKIKGLIDENMWIDNLLGLSGLTKSIKAGFPAIAELAPTEELFGQYIYNQHVKTESSGFAGLVKTKIYEPIDYNQFSIIGKQIFGANYTNAQSMHNSIKSAGINILATLNNSYFIVGTSQPTIASLDFNNGNTLDNLECDGLNYEWEGDGTVPYVSATMIHKLKNTIDERIRTLEVNANHTNIVGAEKTLTWIRNILEKGSSNVLSDNNVKKSYIVLKIACPVDVTVTHNSETLSSDLNNINTIASFGRLDFIGSNDDIKMLCIEDNENYLLKLQGTDTGIMDYTICWFDSDNNMVDERQFKNINISKSTIIDTETNKNKPTVLNIDDNGNGVVDRQILVAKNGTYTEGVDIPSSNGGGSGNGSKSGGISSRTNKVEEKTPDNDDEDISKSTSLPKVILKENAQKIRYMKAYFDNTFKPDQIATRYEILEALNELFDIEGIQTDTTFSDVYPDKIDLVNLFRGAGIVSGYEDGTFKGNNGITRAEFIKLVALSFGLQNNTEIVSKFSDVDGHWAEEYISTFASNGYINGYDDGTFRPDNKITRAETVIVINHVLQVVPNVTINNQYSDLYPNHWAFNDIMTIAK